MTALAIAVAGAIAFVAPVVAARLLDGRTSPRRAAALHVLALTGMAVFPVALLVCLADPGALLGWTCHGPLGHDHPLRWVALGAAAALLLWISHAATRTLRATWRAAPGVLRSAIPASDAGGVPLYILPIEPPLAFATGILRGEVVVSEGLLALLDGEERRAALAHELAHAQEGHPRLLFLGQVVASALGPLPPARRAFTSLRRELEAAADDHAAEVVGDRRIVARAIAKVGLAGASPAPGAALAEEADLAYRIRRLLGDARETRSRGVAAVGLGAILGVGLVVSQCAAFHPGTLWAALAGCTALVWWALLRPFHLVRG